MATTTNYGWTTPDDTALVKDGAAAIRTLGSSVDTTTKNLNPETTLGDIAYRSSTSNVNTRLGIGSTGNILTVAGGVPTWAAPAAAGGMTLISEQTASALSSLSFSSLGSYKQLLLLWNGISHDITGSRFAIRFNSSSGNNYYQGGFTAESTVGMFPYADTATSLRATGGGSSSAYPFGENANTAYGPYGLTGSLLVDNYTSTTKKKYYEAKWYYNDEGNTTHRFIANIQGAWNDVSAITSIDIVRLTGTATFSNATNSSIRLYGIS